MTTKTYVAIIGDIVGSRELKDRYKIQVQLENTLDSININFSRVIESKFTITIGDEFQGLVNREFPLQKFIQFFNQQFITDIYILSW